MSLEFQRMVPVVDGVEETQIIALVDGKCIGRVGIRTDEDNAGIRQLWVDPEFRCQGIGTALMEICHEIAGASDCELITLSAQGPVLRKWYEKQGYKVYDRGAEGFYLMKTLREVKV